MSLPNADANLLFGVLAFQNGFLTRDQLIAGMQAWVENKSRPLDEHLLSAGAISPEIVQLLQPLVAAHIRQHGGDAEQSLAAISSVAEIKRELLQISDSDLTISVQRLRSNSEGSNSDDATLPPRSPSPSDPASTIGVPSSAGSRFHILRPHARGGLGEVFVARDTELGREVALKEIQHDKSDDPDARARFTREAEITGGLEHPGIVPVYGLGCYPDGRPFYAMRFIRGKSLKEAIKAYHGDASPERQRREFEPDAPAREADGSERAEGGGQKEEADPNPKRERGTPSRQRGPKSATEKNLELRRLLQRFIDVCEAIDYAHSRGVLHRDLKPGNIMLGRYGETLVVDWGLAKPLGETPPRPANPQAETGTESVTTIPEGPLQPSSRDSSDPTMLGAALGTPAYMSPEQAQGRIDLLGPASDVFCLGATLYHLLTGRAPYKGDNLLEVQIACQSGEFPRPRSLKPEIPRALEAICLKAMAVKPEQRYATAKELANDVERFLADEPVTVLRETVLARVRRWMRKHSAWTASITVGLSLLTLTAILAAILGWYEIEFIDAQWQEARTQRNEADEVADYMISLFEDNTPDASIKDVLAKAADEIRGRKIDRSFRLRLALVPRPCWFDTCQHF
jgi:serine/threonine-protein kinase